MQLQQVRWLVTFLWMALPAAVLGNESLRTLMTNPNYWAYPGGNYWNWRYSELQQIDVTNVHTLKPGGTFSGEHFLILPSEASGRSNGTLYSHTKSPRSVLAIDLDTLEIVWEYHPEDELPCCQNSSGGLSYGDGMVFLQENDTTLVALKANTGELMWKARTGDTTKGESAVNVPQVIKNNVVVANAGEFSRCSVAAYNITNGALAWRAYCTGSDSDILSDPQRTSYRGNPIGADSSLRSWLGDSWSAGGTVAACCSYDDDLNALFYVATDGPTNAVRPGRSRDKWTNSIIARNVDTGIALWVAPLPEDEWVAANGGDAATSDVDIDSALGIGPLPLDDVSTNVILAILRSGGPATNALIIFNGVGSVGVLDRTTGQQLKGGKLKPKVKPCRTESLCGPRPAGTPRPCSYSICGPYAAFSPQTELFYSGTPLAPDNRYHLVSWRLGTEESVWSNPEAQPITDALSTAGNVVFYGTLEGVLKAADASTGSVLWSFKTSGSEIGNIRTWVESGRQMVGATSGGKFLTFSMP